MLLMYARIHVNGPDFLAVNKQLRPVKRNMLAQVTEEIWTVIKFSNIWTSNSNFFSMDLRSYTYYDSH